MTYLKTLLNLDNNAVKAGLNNLNALSSYEFKPVAHLTSNREESNRLCSICREDYKSGDLLTSLACIHSFHTDCIKEWLKVNIYLKIKFYSYILKIKQQIFDSGCYY